ncbi:SseB protein N-terminal domain-containing protein [Sinosporangium album]|uniref:SseB protein N-terminal domain-containing protein n=1 Tax=Sinosporangium album TaxID=504805 RepID=A0A1G8E2H8_9ACTN|nr:SAV_915 family protein [Sinosporangium album]SDH64172.1 SseB protein N-terminal domain-containing protein [Sinosporangium album]
MIHDGEGEGALLVPVRGGGGTVALRYFRTAAGQRTVVGFTSRERLVGVFGERQESVRLSVPALRAMVGGLGTVEIIVDPTGAAEGDRGICEAGGWRPARERGRGAPAPRCGNRSMVR